jgi:hypothetical protein
MAHYSGHDYPELAKAGFLVGLALFVVGTGGELVGHAVFGSVPGWENAVLFALTIVGFFSPLVFGIALPLVE